MRGSQAAVRVGLALAPAIVPEAGDEICPANQAEGGLDAIIELPR